MLAHEEEKCFFLHKHFLLCSNDKDILTLKTMATYFYCFCIVCVRMASRNKVHKTPKAALAFETSFLRAKPKGTQLLTGDVFEWARFCNDLVNGGDWLGMPQTSRLKTTVL